MSHLVVNKISFSYGRLPVLEDISLTVEAGEVVAVVGPSGCGKTTLLRCISGLLPPLSGSVRLANSSNPNASAYSFVFQKPALLPWLSVMENLEVPFQLRSTDPPAEQISQQLDLLGLSGFEDHYPAQLSVGMAQRVAFARALSESRPVLLLDEPFSALDELTRRELAIRLSETIAASDLMAVFVTHSLHDALFLGNKVVIVSGRPARVLTTIETEFTHPRHKNSWYGAELLPQIEKARRILEEQR